MEIRADLRELATRAARDSAVCEHLARSRAYLEDQRWREAATEAAQALSIDPACSSAAHLAADAKEALRLERFSEDHRAVHAARDAAARPIFEAARAALANNQTLRARWLAEAALAQAPDHEAAARLLLETADVGVEAADETRADSPTLSIAAPRSIGERLVHRTTALVRQVESHGAAVLRRAALWRAARDHAGPPPAAKV